jgi:hypothetical protein
MWHGCPTRATRKRIVTGLPDHILINSSIFNILGDLSLPVSGALGAGCPKAPLTSHTPATFGSDHNPIIWNSVSILYFLLVLHAYGPSQ